jgi:hypothetical protein
MNNNYSPNLQTTFPRKAPVGRYNRNYYNWMWKNIF